MVNVMDKIQQEFEAWANGQGYATDKYDESELSDKYKHLAGTYVIPEARLMIEVWKASRAALYVELPENCKGMALTVDEFHKQLDKAGVSHK